MPQLQKLATALRLSPEQSERFTALLREGNCASTAVVCTPNAAPGYVPPFTAHKVQADWFPAGAFVAGPAVKPGAYADYEAGCYYPLDTSSIWESAPLDCLPCKPQRCLDLCAAPGGKSILTQLRVAPQLHIANEVSPKRLGILRHNLQRCGFGHLYTQRLRPDQWARMTPAGFDLILVDAPCSGQSLLAKNIPNPGCMNPTVIQGNAKRQRGILLAALQCLAPGGYLLYTTCTYSPQENERNIHYLLKRNPHVHTVPVPSLAEFRSPLIEDLHCYRLLPMHGLGAGGFTCLLHHNGAAMQPLPELPESILQFPVQA